MKKLLSLAIGVAVAAATLIAGCVLPEKTDKTNTALGKITTKGLELAQVGTPFANIFVPQRDSLRISDSTAMQEGFVWLVKTVRTPHSEFVFESEAVSESERATLPLKNIARVRIVMPEVHTPEGVGIGSTVADLVEKFTADSLKAEGIPSYQKIQIASPRGHFVYLIDDPAGTAPAQQPIGAIAPTAKVSMLVVM